VLFAGGALALVALRELGIWYTASDVFGYLFVGLASLFATWFFLAGVPRDFAALKQEAPYPKGLKVFTQFVAGLYVGILYAYLLRIVAYLQCLGLDYVPPARGAALAAPPRRAAERTISLPYLKPFRVA